jgi:hypothetical protein
MIKKMLLLVLLLLTACRTEFDEERDHRDRERQDKLEADRAERRARVEEQKLVLKMERWKWVVECARRERYTADVDTGDTAKAAKSCAAAAQDAWAILGGADAGKTGAQP